MYLCTVNVVIQKTSPPSAPYRNVTTLKYNFFTYLNKCVHEGFEITLFFNILHIHLVTMTVHVDLYLFNVITSLM